MNLEQQLGQVLKEKKLTISTAESCTGGLVSSRLTDISGSSDYIKLNFVTYANQAKHDILGVTFETLDNFGAVSEECAYEMANGLQKVTGCDIALCTTGIAGPTGGTKDKPVGLMYTSAKFNGITTVKKIKIDSSLSRIDIKKRFADEALKLALSVLEDNRLA